MDTKAQRKALFRSKLREASQNRDKHIDSALVRYNEYDQPVCRVCNVILKSESLWPAHQASRKHHEAIENIKATAAGLTHANKANTEPAVELHKPQSSSTLPADFFDNQTQKRKTSDSVSLPGGSGLSDIPYKKKDVSATTGPSLEAQESVKTVRRPTDHLVEMKERSVNKPSSKLDQPSKNISHTDAKRVKRALPESIFDNKESSESRAPRNIDSSEVKLVKGTLPDGFFENNERVEATKSDKFREPSKNMDNLASTQVKGALPEGFFDNKDADLRARGIEPVKIDVNDAYKEFEKEIHDDLQEVDNRLEEEEIDAAEVREGYESLEQKAYWEKVEMVKKQLMDAKAAKLAKGRKSPAFKGKNSSDESSSDEDDDDDDESFAVDWRAKHL